MTISMFRAKVKKRKVGKFRLLKPGEMLEEHDIQIGPSWYGGVSDSSIGVPCAEHETILRLEFEDK